MTLIDSAEAMETFAPLLRARQVVLIGEVPGTVEFPELVSVLTSTAAARGLAVTVGLEVGCSEQEALDAVLADPTAGVSGPWWERAAEFQDGRSSKAMASLVVALSQFRAAGADVAVVAMDGPWVAPGSPVPLDQLELVSLPRDDVMANLLLNMIDQRPKALSLILAGVEHTTVGQPSSPSPVRPLGSLVRAWHPEAVALRGRCLGGTNWQLSVDGRSGPTPVGDDSGLPLGALWTRAPGADGHHGYVNVGPVTASPPVAATA